MQEITGLMVKRAKELLESGEVKRVVGWTTGDFLYDVTPAVFEKPEDLEEGKFVYNCFCGANLSKYLIQILRDEINKVNTAKAMASRKGENPDDIPGPGKTLVFLKPCDTYSFNQLLTEHRIDKDLVHVIGIACRGMVDIERIKLDGVTGITKALDKGDKIEIKTVYGDKTYNRNDILLGKCSTCKGKELKYADEVIDPEPLPEGEGKGAMDRMAGVEMLEEMSPEERFAFWNEQLSRCIKCYACRNVCPACSCIHCVFDNSKSGVASKANVTEFEEKMYHIIRAFHVAGRCTDCGECSRVCPEQIPLHLLNRKFIKDINEFYGEYQAGEKEGQISPLTNFDADNDAEPSIVIEKGGDKK